ncbi:MAG TPA: phosphoribosylglycinamide formyltransferase [Acidocella sp.]|nr:MAG: phosphoribosylglycinamide formyltransferase [Acidocella sp. 20-58-15]HQT38631.1 phosphoribosylglycinamide formyltransferase [Acidocella sp.]
MKPRVAILISGRGSNMTALIEAAKMPDYPAEIVLVLSNREDAPGLKLARDLGVRAVSVETRPFGRDREAHERAVNAELRKANVQIVCLAGYMRLLTPYLVNEWAGRMLNIHPSLLPKYPGLDTHKKALEAGELVHGCTVHLVTEDMDAGPILAQGEVPVLPGDTEDTLAARVLGEEHRIYPKALAKLVIGNNFKT